MLKYLITVLALASAGALAEDVYTATQPNGCKVHNPNPYSNDTAEWQGACNAAGFAEGEGVLRFRNHAGETELSGYWQNGKTQGIGIGMSKLSVRPVEDIYAIGEFLDGKQNGVGTMFILNRKELWHGQWRKGLLENGEWRSIAADNRIHYQGTFQNFKFHGFGTLTMDKRSKTFHRLDAKQRTQGKWQGDDYVLRGWFENGNFIAPCATAAQCAKRR